MARHSSLVMAAVVLVSLLSHLALGVHVATICEQSENTSHPDDDVQLVPDWINGAGHLTLSLGDVMLLPMLSPPAGLQYTFKSANTLTPFRYHSFKLLEGKLCQAYPITLSSVTKVADGTLAWKESTAIFSKILQIMGLAMRCATRHHTTRAFAGPERDTHLFTLRDSGDSLRSSFRILPPSSKEDDDALFTINADVFGGKWRIYKGRKRSNPDPVYIGVSLGTPGDYNFCKTEAGCGQDGNSIIASMRGGWVEGSKFSLFDLTVGPGEDSGLLLATATAISIAKNR